MNTSIITPGSQNIFEDLGFPPQEAEHLLVRADLMLQIRRLIQAQQWTTDQAAQQLATTPDRIQSLLNGKMGEFTIEQLIELLSYSGMKIRLEIMPIAA